MAIKNSFDSKINKLINFNNLQMQIRKAHLGGRLLELSPSVKIITELDTEVGPFIHPMYDAEKDLVFVDMRPYTSVKQGGGLNIRNQLDYELNVTRANLELAWCRSNTRDDLFNAFTYSGDIFIRWLSDLIAYRHGLQAIQKVKVIALCAMYNIGLYYNNVTDPVIANRYFLNIANSYPAVSIDTAREVYERIGNVFPRDIDEFVDALKMLEISTRLNDLSSVTLYNMLGGSWFINAGTTEILALALEYPPAFTTLVHMSIDNNVYKRTSIGTTVANFNKNNAHALFERGLGLTIRRYTE